MSVEDDAQERFRSIYGANYAQLAGYAMRRVSTPEDAADVVAETFLIAWRRLDRVPSGDEARLWLYGTARRVLANQRRAEGRRTRLTERLGVEFATAVAAGLTTIDTHGGDGAATRALDGLSNEDRDLIGLVAWEGLSSAELGVVLGCSTNAARIRLYRVRRHLARDLVAPTRKSRPATGNGPATHGQEPVLPSTEETR